MSPRTFSIDYRVTIDPKVVQKEIQNGKNNQIIKNQNFRTKLKATIAVAIQNLKQTKSQNKGRSEGASANLKQKEASRGENGAEDEKRNKGEGGKERVFPSHEDTDKTTSYVVRVAK
ncbi:hypothetical protein L484_008206 [Morus notabilis]|uniref:Uncharacterized protein n=1 Tax=Morus notabilis TaxID=981085 RepID=W9RVL8_9ROSA|nr:hypothetical protein L484_008206 [Morus notabilis]